MNYRKEKYINKKIQLYPGDTYAKLGIIKDVDDLGWTIEVTESKCSTYKAGNTYFISHSSSFTFSLVERKIIISDIEWDTDADDYENDHGLPDTIHITVTPKISYLLDDIDGEADNLIDYLSSELGWCVKGFSVEEE